MSTAFRAGIRPPSLLSPPDWASKHTPLANSSRGKKYSIDQAPWHRAPMETAADADTRVCVFYAPTGAGKSAMAEALISWVVSEAPGGFLYASQKNADAKFWFETRLTPALKGCRPIKPFFPTDRHKIRNDAILFRHMPLIAGGANMSNFQEKSMRYFYGDEVWAWKKGLVREGIARLHDRWNGKALLVSQAGFKGDDMELQWANTDQARWSFKCSGCGDYQAYQRKVIKYDEVKNPDGTINIKLSSETARVECPSCGETYKDTPQVRRQLTNTADYIPQCDAGVTGYRGFKMHRLGIWWIPWAKYVEALLTAKNSLKKGDVTLWRQLAQKDDCEPWDDEMSIQQKEISTQQPLIKELDPKAPIEGETLRIMSCDRGKDHHWAVVRAWAKGQKSELLFEGYIASSTDDGERLKAVQEKYGVKDKCVFVDVGFEWTDTIQMCADNNWWGIRGNGQTRSFPHEQRGGGKVDQLWSKIKYATGTKGNRARWIEIATNPTKDTVSRLMNGQGMAWTVPSDVSKAYHRHMRAEHRVIEQRGKNNLEEAVWRQIKNRANHLFDCEVYNTAVALMMGQLE